jgi:hypothetical protein
MDVLTTRRAFDAYIKFLVENYEPAFLMDGVETFVKQMQI